MRVTIIKHKNNRITYTRKDLEVLVDEIRKGCYLDEMTQLRSLWDVYGESKPKLGLENV